MFEANHSMRIFLIKFFDPYIIEGRSCGMTKHMLTYNKYLLQEA